VQVQALAEDTDDDAEDVAKTYRRRQHERDRAREAAARRRDRDGFLSNSSSRGVPASPSTDSFRLSVDSRDSGLNGNGNGNGNASPSGSLKTLSTGSVLGTQVLGDGAPPAARRSASSGRWVSMRIRPSPPTLSLPHLTLSRPCSVSGRPPAKAAHGSGKGGDGTWTHVTSASKGPRATTTSGSPGDDDGSPEAAPAAANAATGWAGALLQMLSPAKPPGADSSQLADRLLSADARGLHGNNTAGGGDDIEGNGGGASPLPSPEQLQGLRRYGLLNGIQVPFPRPC